MGLLVEALRWFLGFNTAGALLTYVICSQTIRGTNWYQYGEVWIVTGAKMIGKWPYNAVALVIDGVVIAPGQDYFMPDVLLQIMWTMGPLCMAATATALLQALPRRGVQKQKGMLGRILLMGKRILFFDLPPRRLLAWCIGGFSVLDFLLVGAWVGLQVLWVQQFAKKAFNDSRDLILGLGPLADPAYQYYWENMAHALGWTGLVNLSFLFLPVPRNNFLHYIFNTDWSQMIKYHRWLGYGTTIMVGLHGGAYVTLWTKQGKLVENAFSWAPDGTKQVSYLAGSIASGGGGLILLTSLPWVRRNHFEIFYFAHITGFLIFTIFASIHYWQRWYYTTAGIVLMFLDWTFRLAQQLHPSFVQGEIEGGDSTDIITLRLDWDKATSLEPGQYMLICMPTATRWEWHPVSVAGVVERGGKPQAVAHMKVSGRWTKELKELLLVKGRAVMRVEGPYGNPRGLCWLREDAILIIAGGIGVTPVLGMLREMVKCQANARSMKAAPVLMPQVTLIWACRTRAEFALLDAQLLTVSREERGWLSMQLYLTGPDTGERHSNFDGKLPSPELRADVPSKTASPFLLRPGLLRPYHFGTLHLCAATVLAFVGAFFCLLATQAIGIYFSWNSTFAKQGLLTWVAMIVGAMGLPAVIIFPLQIFRPAKGGSQAWERRAGPRKKDSPSLLNDDVLSTKPSWIVNPIADTCNLWAEEGTYSGFTTGRPAVAELVREFAQAKCHLPSVAVFAAGPAALNKATRLACANWNDKFNLPFLDYSAHTMTV